MLLFELGESLIDLIEGPDLVERKPYDTRLLRESVREAISAASSDFSITSRMNIYDWFPYTYGFGVNEGEGITPDFSEAIRLASELAASAMATMRVCPMNFPIDHSILDSRTSMYRTAPERRSSETRVPHTRTARSGAQRNANHA